MDHIGLGLVFALLLLIQYGNGADLNITSSNPSPTLLAGETIDLHISYSSTPSLIIWSVNGSIVAVWTSGGEQSIGANYQNRLTLQEKLLSIKSSTPADSGEYMVKVNDTSGNAGSFVFHVVVRDKAQVIQSADTGIYKTGENISLTISYAGQPSAIFWNYNGSPLVIRAEGYYYISTRFDGRTILKEDGSLLINKTTKDDAGNYTVTLTTTLAPGSRSFMVRFYDIIRNVSVIQTPPVIDENSPIVKLSCQASSSSGSVTWKKDGQPVNDDSTHVLQGQDLQIIQPNRTFSGNYTCNMTNPVSWDVGSKNMTVYYPVKDVIVMHWPKLVSEKNTFVNLTCNSSTGYIESVSWKKDGQSITTDLNYKLLDGNQTLQIIQPKGSFSGNYICNISNAAHWGSGSLNIRVYNPVENVVVTQSPEEVSEGAEFVKLICSASSGYIEEVKWAKDGQSVISKDSYSLLDENRVLQITQPNSEFSGEYSCTMLNEVYTASGSRTLTISYAPPSVTGTYVMIITSLLGGILLAH